jgi:hypothetical protein
MQISLVGLNARYTHSCLALFYVRNELLSHCADCDVLIQQFTINDSYFETLLQLGAGSADYYFFSASVWNSDVIVRLIDDLLRIHPQCFCVVGGPQAEVVGAMNIHPRCHPRIIVVKGEIERVGAGFYKDLEEKSLRQSYSGSKGGREFSAPYVETDFADHLQNRHIYYETSRGCPFSCTYCLSAVQKGVYHKDLGQIKAELTMILRSNPHVLRFVDRTFNDNTDRALAIWKFLAEQRCDTVFHFEMSPDRFTEEMFVFLEQLPAGRFQFEIGIQSTNPATLAAIRRPMDVTAAHDTLVRLSRLNTIHLHADLILGLPHDTEETFLASFKDVFAMSPHYIQMGLLKVLPDTPMCHTAPEYGYISSSSPPYPVFANGWLDHRKMQKLYWFGECVERFVNNRYFVSLWQYFRDIDIDIVAFFLDLLEMCRHQGFFQRAPTQELLTSMILDCVKKRSDLEYILELLRYDWLRCGHRFLPEKLSVAEEKSSKNVKKILFRHLSNNFVSDDNGAERMYLLKKGFFLEFSRRFIKEQGYESGEGRHFLCFDPERELNLHRFNRVVRFYLPKEI